MFDWSYTHPIVRDVLNANMVGMLQVGPNLSANVSLTPEVEHAHATAIQVIAKSFYDEGLALLKERRKSGYYRQAHAIRATARFIRGANDGDIGLFAGAERAGNFAGAGAAWADAIEAGTMTAQVEMQLFNLRREKAIEQLTDAQRAELQSVKHELLLGNQ